jgi:hypothetical protein
MVAAPSREGSVTDQEHEIAFRLLTFDVRLRVPAAVAEPFGAHFVTPPDQDAPVRATWPYRVTIDPDAGLSLWEGDDRFAQAPDATEATTRLERRVVGRALDHFSRWGWLVMAGRTSDAGGRRTLTVGQDDGTRTLLRGGRVQPLPLPLPFAGPLPGPAPFTELAIVGGSLGPLPMPAALTAVLDAALSPIPGGQRAAFREVTAALRGVAARGLPVA